jgi:ribose transport system substrate-binding protein
VLRQREAVGYATSRLIEQQQVKKNTGANTMKRSLLSLFLAPAVFAGLALAQFATTAPAAAAANCVKGEHKPPYKLGWANIYSVPTWMKETTATIEAMADELKKQGLVDKLTITDAQGNANTQIQQIQSMIDAKLDAIIVDAGSATALDRVIADACAKGIVVANFDSLVDTNDLTTKIDTDQNLWGKLATEWLVGQLGGKGKILVLNGPAGVSVSDDRRAGAGSGDQPAVQQSRDRRYMVAGWRAVRRRGDGVRKAGTQAGADDRRELSPVP